MFPFISQPGFCSVQPSGHANTMTSGKAVFVGMGLAVSVGAIVLVNLAVAMSVGAFVLVIVAVAVSVGAFVEVAVCTGDWISPDVSFVGRFSLNLGSERSMPPLFALLSSGLRSSL